MPEDQSEYPPQFASSDLSALLGQINDFAGVPPPPPPPPGPMEMAMAKNASSPASGASDALSRKLLSGDYAVPVSIVGSQAQRGPYLPGLKDLLIAVTYLRLAEQITTPELQDSAQKLAYELMQKGTGTLGAHITKQRRVKKKK